MSDFLRLTGDAATQPSTGVPSFDPQVVFTHLDETIELKRKLEVEYDLTADPAQDVTLGGLAAVNILLIKVAEGASVKVGITWSGGTLQVLPVDSLLQLISLTEEITAIQLTRTSGIDTTVKLFLGELAP